MKNLKMLIKSYPNYMIIQLIMKYYVLIMLFVKISNLKEHI